MFLLSINCIVNIACVFRLERTFLGTTTFGISKIMAYQLVMTKQCLIGIFFAAFLGLLHFLTFLGFGQFLLILM